MKKLVLIFTIVLAVVGLASCVDQGGYNPDEEYNIEIAIWGGDSDREVMEERVREFNKIYPNITVEILHLPSDYDQTVQTMMAGGESPDLIQVAEGVHQWSKRGQLLSLNTFVDDNDLDLESRFGTSYKTYEFEGDLYAFPDRGGAMVLYYNTDLFDAANLEYPSKDWTWTEFLTAAQAIANDDTNPTSKIYGFAAGGWWPWWMSFMYQNGGRIIDDEGNVVVNSPENKEALEFYNDLVYKHKVAPSPGEYQDMGIGSPDTLFAQGRVGMGMTGWWQVGSLQNVSNLNWNIAPIFGESENATVMFGAAFGISSMSTQQETAFMFLDFLSSEEGQKPIVDAKFDIPSNVSVLQGDFQNQTWSNNEDLDLTTLFKSADMIMNLPNGPYWNQLLNIMSAQLDLFFLNEMTAQEALTKIEENLIDLLSE